MKILYHHRTQGKGVEAIHITSIVKELRKFGHTVEILSPPGINPEKEIFQETKGSNKKSFWKFLSRKCPEAIFELVEIVYNIYSYHILKSRITQDSIHGVYERYFLFSLSSYLLARRFDKCLIYEVNDSAFLPRVRPLFFQGIARAIERKVLSNASYIIVVSKAFKNQLIKNGIPSDKIIVLHNAVDPDHFDISGIEQPKGFNEKLRGKTVIGFTGLFVPWHGLGTFLTVFNSIKKIHPSSHLLLVGDGPIVSDLKKDIEQLQLKDDVTITGFVPHRDIPGYISMMDICLIANHETYTSPVKLFEYMAMGKAVVAPDMENIKEVVTDSFDSLLFTPNDKGDLERKIDLLIRDPHKRAAIGEEARKNVLQNHTWDNNARIIESLFSKSV